MPSRRVAEEGERDAALYGRSHHRRWGERDGGRGGPQGRPVDAGPAPRQLSALLGQRGRGQGLLPRRGPISRRRHRRSPRGARPGRRRLVRGQGGVMKPVRLRLFALAATTSAVMGPLVVIAGPATSAHAATHHVLVVPRDFSTIQAAVDAASPGDTVNVSPGTFTEQVVINKDLDLHGAGAAVDPTDQVGIRVRLNAVAQVSGNTISGGVCSYDGCGFNPISQFQAAGAFVEGGTGTTFTGNHISGAGEGIGDYNSVGVTI